MRPALISAILLIGWALIVTAPEPRTIKAGFADEAACENAATAWREAYKRHVRQAKQNKYMQRRRIAQAIPPTRCVNEAVTKLPPS
jgi:hypothetical protein